MRYELRPLSFRLICTLSLGLGALACADDSTSAEEGSETTNASGTAAETSSTEEGTTDSDPTTTSADATTASFISEEGPGETTETMPGNLGDQCMTDAECAEDLFCNGIQGFGGVCSECASDADCPDGSNCTISADGWFACGDGSLGQMCESDASCAGDLFCAELVDLGGLFNGNFCSECAEDGHCPDGQLCAPQLEFMDLMNIGGQRACIDPGTHPQDSLCDHEANGDEQCEGFCTVADLMGFIQLGLCGECETDDDCEAPQTCMPAVLDFMGVTGSTCG